jgi:peroxiredoxin Q/BCP
MNETKNEIVEVGEKFPAFSLQCVAASPEGMHVEERSNQDFLGKPLIVFFYPKDATCGCTAEVIGFRDAYEEFGKLGVQVLGVSRDTAGAHKKFIESQNLPFPLLCDRERVLAAQLGLLVQKTMYGKPVTGSLRNTFALDENGVVLQIWERVAPESHASQVLDWCHDNL